jgi:pimeloyl-ACP methyl ester carboxylesterase
MASRWAITIMALIAVAIGLFELRSTGDGLRITRTVIDETPVTIFQPDETAAAPVVVIAHGFAGSQQLMQPFAETFARNGYIAVTFDFLGHGRNPVPMHGDVTEGKAITSALLEQLGRIVGFARTLPGGDGRSATRWRPISSCVSPRRTRTFGPLSRCRCFRPS